MRKLTLFALGLIMASGFAYQAKAEPIFQLTWAPGYYRVCVSYYMGSFLDITYDEINPVVCEDLAYWFGEDHYGINDWLDTYKVNDNNGTCYQVTPDGYTYVRATAECVDWLKFVNDWYGNYWGWYEIESAIYDLMTPPAPHRGGGSF
jgi:hypothetical protein